MAQNPPSWMPAYPYTWKRLRQIFEDTIAMGLELRPVLRNEAMAKSYPMVTAVSGWRRTRGNKRKFEEVKIAHEQLIPYREFRDHEHFEEAWSLIKNPPNVLKQCLHDKRFTLEFVVEWGRLMQAGGVVEAAYYASSEKDDLRGARSGAASRKATTRKDRRLYAAMWQDRWMNDDKWKERWPFVGGQLIMRARGAFNRFVLELVNGKRRPPPGYQKSWFEEFLSKKRKKSKKGKKSKAITSPIGRILSPNYSSKLTKPIIKQLLSSPPVDQESLPPLDW